MIDRDKYLRDFARNCIEEIREMREAKGVGSAGVSGSAEEIIRVLLDREHVLTVSIEVLERVILAITDPSFDPARREPRLRLVKGGGAS